MKTGKFTGLNRRLRKLEKEVGEQDGRIDLALILEAGRRRALESPRTDEERHREIGESIKKLEAELPGSPPRERRLGQILLAARRRVYGFPNPR